MDSMEYDDDVPENLFVIVAIEKDKALDLGYVVSVAGLSGIQFECLLHEHYSMKEYVDDVLSELSDDIRNSVRNLVDKEYQLDADSSTFGVLSIPCDQKEMFEEKLIEFKFDNHLFVETLIEHPAVAQYINRLRHLGGIEENDDDELLEEIEDSKSSESSEAHKRPYDTPEASDPDEDDEESVDQFEDEEKENRSEHFVHSYSTCSTVKQDEDIEQNDEESVFDEKMEYDNELKDEQENPQISKEEMAAENLDEEYHENNAYMNGIRHEDEDSTQSSDSDHQDSNDWSNDVCGYNGDDSICEEVEIVSEDSDVTFAENSSRSSTDGEEEEDDDDDEEDIIENSEEPEVSPIPAITIENAGSGSNGKDEEEEEDMIVDPEVDSDEELDAQVEDRRASEDSDEVPSDSYDVFELDVNDVVMDAEHCSGPSTSTAHSSCSPKSSTEFQPESPGSSNNSVETEHFPENSDDEYLDDDENPESGDDYNSDYNSENRFEREYSEEKQRETFPDDDGRDVFVLDSEDDENDEEESDQVMNFRDSADQSVDEMVDNSGVSDNISEVEEEIPAESFQSTISSEDTDSRNVDAANISSDFLSVSEGEEHDDDSAIGEESLGTMNAKDSISSKSQNNEKNGTISQNRDDNDEFLDDYVYQANSGTLPIRSLAPKTAVITTVMTKRIHPLLTNNSRASAPVIENIRNVTKIQDTVEIPKCNREPIVKKILKQAQLKPRLRDVIPSEAPVSPTSSDDNVFQLESDQSEISNEQEDDQNPQECDSVWDNNDEYIDDIPERSPQYAMEEDVYIPGEYSKNTTNTTQEEGCGSDLTEVSYTDDSAETSNISSESEESDLDDLESYTDSEQEDYFTSNYPTKLSSMPLSDPSISSTNSTPEIVPEVPENIEDDKHKENLDESALHHSAYPNDQKAITTALARSLMKMESNQHGEVHHNYDRILYCYTSVSLEADSAAWAEELEDIQVDSTVVEVDKIISVGEVNAKYGYCPLRNKEMELEFKRCKGLRKRQRAYTDEGLEPEAKKNFTPIMTDDIYTFAMRATTERCRICRKRVYKDFSCKSHSADIQFMMSHVKIHSEQKQFSCVREDCDFTNSSARIVHLHIVEEHKINEDPIDNGGPEMDKALVKLFKKCFPRLRKTMNSWYSLNKNRSEVRQ